MTNLSNKYSKGMVQDILQPIVVRSCTRTLQVTLNNALANLLRERPSDRCRGEDYSFDAWMHLQFVVGQLQEFSTV